MNEPSNDLERAAQKESRTPLLKDFCYFLLTNKKWWLLPILIVLLALSLLMLLSSTAIAPFIYTLF
ncbi:MAG: DUF5989 family protein [Gemmataceae bacterium]